MTRARRTEAVKLGEHGRFARLAALIVAVSVLFGGLGCGRAAELDIPSWSLSTQGRTYAVTLPKHLDDVLPQRDATYTLSASVQLPAALRDRPLTLAITHLPALCSLRVDGQEVPALDTSSSDDYRTDGFLRWRIPESATSHDTLSLTLVVEHRWTQSGWVDAIPRLSATPRGDRWFLFVRHFNTTAAAIALGAAALTFFGYALVFLFDRKQVAQGWFALQAITAAPWGLFQLGLTQSALGVYDAPAVTFLLLVAMLSSGRFTHALVHLPKPGRVWDLQIPVGAALVAFAAGPFALTRYFAPFVVALITTQVVYQIFILVRIRRGGDRSLGVLLLLLSWIQLGASGTGDFIAWLGFGEIWGGIRLGCVGITLFALFQLAVLSHSYTRLNTELEARVALLQERNDQVRVLNVELRRQIVSRSEQLAFALARAGTAEPARALQPGDVVDGRFRVVRPVGAGGMGAVFEIVRLVDGQRLALKVLTGATDRLDYARFAREAQLAAQVEHPCIVSVLDFHVAADGAFLLIMEYVDGTSLRDARARYGEVLWAMEVLERVAAGLAAIHALDIVHRDLKPANILLAHDEPGKRRAGADIKIADFGISSPASWGRDPSGAPILPPDALIVAPVVARRMPMVSQGRHDAIEADDDDVDTMTLSTVRTAGTSPPHVPQADRSTSELTAKGTIMGTPHYIAPELAGPTGPMPSADMFSFGVIAYELFTGRLPFHEPLVAARLAGRAVPPPAPLRLECKEMDSRTAALIERCLAEDPEARPTAEEVFVHLRAIRRRSLWI